MVSEVDTYIAFFQPVHRELSYFCVLVLRSHLRCGVQTSLLPAVAVAGSQQRRMRRVCCRLLRHSPFQPSLRSDVTRLGRPVVLRCASAHVAIRLS